MSGRKIILNCNATATIIFIFQINNWIKYITIIKKLNATDASKKSLKFFNIYEICCPLKHEQNP